MDDRQAQLQIGAGLQESRLNTELIAFLQKWGGHALLGVAVLIGLYAAYVKINQWQQSKLDSAFESFEAAYASGSPETLLQVAREHKARGAVWQLASLTAAELILDAARVGVRPGGNVQLPAPGDILSETEAKELTAQARQIYSEVLVHASGNPKEMIFAQQARWGLATAAIDLGEFDEAARMLREYADEAEKHGLSDQAARARERLKQIESMQGTIPVFSEAELPEANRWPKPQPATITNEGGTTTPQPVMDASQGPPVPSSVTDPQEVAPQ